MLAGSACQQAHLSRAKKQALLLTALQHRPHALDELADQGLSRAVIRALAAKDLIEYCDIKGDHRWASRDHLDPTEEQQRAITTINSKHECLCLPPARGHHRKR